MQPTAADIEFEARLQPALQHTHDLKVGADSTRIRRRQPEQHASGEAENPEQARSPAEMVDVEAQHALDATCDATVEHLQPMGANVVERIVQQLEFGVV